MARNTSFIANGLQPIRFADPMEQFGKALQLKGLLAQQQSQDQAQADDQAQRAAFTSANGDPAKYLKNLMVSPAGPKAYQGALTAYQAFLKSQGEIAHVASQTAQQNAAAGKQITETQGLKIAQHRDSLANVNDPQSAAQWTISAFKDPDMGPILNAKTTLEDAIGRIPTEPGAFQQWKSEQALGATKFLEMNKPTYQIQGNGQKRDILSFPGLGGAPTTVSSVQMAATPGEVLTDQRVRSEGGLNRSAQAGIAAGVQAGANTRADAARNAQFKIAGIDPQTGNFVGGADGTMGGLVDMLGQNKIPVSTALARTAPGMKSQILSAVQQKYPGWTDLDYASGQTAARSFATGPYAQKIDASNTAMNHLATLGELATAWGSGNVQLFNKIAAAWGQQTGNPTPTNLKAAVTMVGPEITKAVVGAGGGVEDRKKTDQALSLIASSPAQAAGTIKTMQELMAGRLSEVERTYKRTTKRTDFRDNFLSPESKSMLDARDSASTPSMPAAPAKTKAGATVSNW